MLYEIQRDAGKSERVRRKDCKSVTTDKRRMCEFFKFFPFTGITSIR